MPSLQGSGSGKMKVNKSADKRFTFKKPPSGPWDDYFYTGPTWDWGHVQKPKKTH